MNIDVLLWLAGLLYILSCGWLVLVILLQEGKSGGMGGADQGGQAPAAMTETFGAGGAQSGMFKMTSWTAAIFFLLAIILTLLGTRKEQAGGALNLGEEQPAAQTEVPEGQAGEQPVQPGTQQPANQQQQQQQQQQETGTPQGSVNIPVEPQEQQEGQQP